MTHVILIGFMEDCVLVTPDAEARLTPLQVWYHFGGWSDEGDTFDTQLEQFEEDLDRFWANVVGPDEHLRSGILRALGGIRPEWARVIVSRDGVVTIRFVEGAEKILYPPHRHTRSTPVE